jgi:hypothetical protein
MDYTSEGTLSPRRATGEAGWRSTPRLASLGRALRARSVEFIIELIS